MSLTPVVRRFLPLSLVAWVLVGCQTQPPMPEVVEPVAPVDPTPPQLRLGSAGLLHNLDMTQDAKNPQQRRARSMDELLLVATATDAETGIKRINLKGEIQVTCNLGNDRKLVKRVEPIDESVFMQQDGKQLPLQVHQKYSLTVGAEREKCGEFQFVEMRLEVLAETENGDGQITQLQPAVVRYFGPDEIRVGLLDVRGDIGHYDTVYLRWGATLGRMADVVLLTEVPDQRHADLVAATAGMPYVAMGDPGTQVAILSHTPLRDVQLRVIDPPGNLDNNSYILSAITDLEGYPHQFVATYWSKYDANDTSFAPDTSAPSRLQAANVVLEEVTHRPEVSIVGGTLNAYSGIGPQWRSGVATDEVNLLRSRLLDAFSVLQLPNEKHCSDQRLDYLLSAGPVVARQYESCFPDAQPSDHPFVLVTFGAD